MGGCTTMSEWGGPRPGAGRKPKQPGKARVTLSTRVSVQSSEQLRAYAKSAGKPLGEVLDAMVSFIARQPAFMLPAAAEPPDGTTVAPLAGLPPDLLNQAFLDLIPGGVAITDTGLVVRLANPAFHAAVGLAPQTLVGQRLDELFSTTFQQARDACRRALAAGETHVVLCNNASPVSCWEVRVCPVYDPAGVIQGVAVHIGGLDPGVADPDCLHVAVPADPHAIAPGTAEADTPAS